MLNNPEGSVTRHKNQNKKSETWRYVYRKIAITQRFDIEDIEQKSQIRVVELKNYIWRSIMKAETFYF